MGSGSGDSAMLELKARPMLAGDFEPLFKLEHMHKDVRHCSKKPAWRLEPPAVAEAAEKAYAEAERGGPRRTATLRP